jgi:hypothetical protein
LIEPKPSTNDLAVSERIAGLVFVDELNVRVSQLHIRLPIASVNAIVNKIQDANLNNLGTQRPGFDVAEIGVQLDISVQGDASEVETGRCPVINREHGLTPHVSQIIVFNGHALRTHDGGRTSERSGCHPPGPITLCTEDVPHKPSMNCYCTQMAV